MYLSLVSDLFCTGITDRFFREICSEICYFKTILDLMYLILKLM